MHPSNYDRNLSAELGDKLSMGTHALPSSSEETRVLKENWDAGLAVRKARLTTISRNYSTQAQRPTTFDSLMSGIAPSPSSKLDNWQSNLKNEIASDIKVLEITANLFIRALHPFTPTLDFFLGLLLRVIKMSQEVQRNWKDFVRTVDEICQSLEKLNDSASWFANDTGDSGGRYRLGETISRVFMLVTDLLMAYIEAIKNDPKHLLKENQLRPKGDKYVKKIRHLTTHFCDLVASEHRLKQRLNDDGTSLTMTSVSEPSSVFPLKVLPYPAYRGFFGRKDILTKLDVELGLVDFDQRSGDDVKSVLLHGLGGVGKSQTARAFAHFNQGGFDAVFWVRSDNDINIKTSFTTIAIALNLPGAKQEGHDDENWVHFTRWLDRQAAAAQGKRWLIIFDNCDHIEDIYPRYIPKTKGSILITSRFQSAKLPDSVTLPICPFDEKEGITLMKRLIEPKVDTGKSLTTADEKALRGLLENVDGLPLAIHVLVALMLPRIPTITSFYEFYKENSRALMTKARREADYDRDSERKVGEMHVLDNVWYMSFQTLNPNALSIMGMLSFLAPNDISVSWFDLRSKDGLSNRQVLSICQDPVELDDAIVTLQEAALINLENDDDVLNDVVISVDPNDSDAVQSSSDASSIASSENDLGAAPIGLPEKRVSVHRLVQEALIYSRKPEEIQEIFNAAVDVVFFAFPNQTNGETLEAESGRCKRLVPHVISLAARFQEFGPSTQHRLKPSEKLASILKSTIWYLYENGDGRTAVRLLSIAYGVYLEKDTEDYADLQFKAGSIYLDRNELKNCRDVWEEARDIYELRSAQGSATAQAALSWVIHSLGNLESADGNIEEALKLYERADAMRKAEGQPLEWREALAKMTSGRAYFLRGDYDEALSRYDEAEKTFRDDSTWMAYLKYAYGNVQLANGDLDSARRYYSESEVCWLSSAELHLGLSACYYMLACLDIQQQRNSSALEYLKRASKIAKHQANGDQARILRKRAQVLEADGRQKDAQQYMRQAEETRLKIRDETKTALKDTDASWDSLVCIFWR